MAFNYPRLGLVLGSDNSVWIEHPDRSISSIQKKSSTWNQYFLRGVKLADKKINFIHIEARTFTFRLKSPRCEDAEIDLGEYGCESCRFRSHQVPTIQGGNIFSKELMGIVIGNSGYTNFYRSMIMGVEQKGDFAERVGVFEVLRRRYGRYDSPGKALFVFSNIHQGGDQE